MSCTAEILTADANCLSQGMSERQLLAAILCVLATQNGMQCDATTLIENSRCLWMGMSERQLLASIALLLCGGGVGPGTPADVQIGATDPFTAGGSTPILYTNTTCDAEWLWEPPPAGFWRQLNNELATGKYTCPTVVELRQIPTQTTCTLVEAHTFGRDAVGDDQPQWYRWNPDGTGADDGLSNILPNDRVVGDTGRWQAVTFA